MGIESNVQEPSKVQDRKFKYSSGTAVSSFSRIYNFNVVRGNARYFDMTII